MTVLVSGDGPGTEHLFVTAIGDPANCGVVGNVADLRDWMQARPAEELIVLGPDIDLAVALEVASTERVMHPTTGVILIRHRIDSGTLGQSLRAGVREVVAADDLQGLTGACRRSITLTRQLRQSSGSPGSSSHASTVITVFSAKGGCGKTAVATNLAAALANGGTRRVCLVDLDLAFGDVGVILQIQPVRTIADAAAAPGLIDDLTVQSLIINHSAGLDLILSPLEPGKSESIQATYISQVLGVLRNSYDVVVVDTASSFSDQALAAFDITDYYLLLATLDVAAVKNLRITLQTLELLGYPRDRWRVILNRADAKVGMSSADVEKALGVAITAEIPSSRSVPASMNRGKPLVLDEPSHAVSIAIKRIAAGLVGRSASSSVANPRRSLGRLRPGRAHATR